MTGDLTKDTDPKFKHLLGKRVTVVCKGKTWTGKLEFAGINTVLHNQFQVTIGRTPLWPVDPDSLVEEPLN
jgi:hypothetical protein